MSGVVDLGLEGKAVLVTGGASGIGAALAEGFADAGASVAIHYRSNAQEAGEFVERSRAKGCESVAVGADLVVPGEAARVVDRVLEAFGRVDVLVNNAGTMVGRAKLSDMDDAYFHAVVDVNLYSTVACCRAAIPGMTERGTGAVVNVTSIAARQGGGPGAVLYGAAKGAVSTFTRGIAREVASFGVRVNALSPGIVATRFHEQYSTPDSLAALVETVPMRRVAEAREMVGPVLFLASDAMSGYMTGQILEVNGGLYSP